MHPIDLAIFLIYIVGLLLFGYFFFRTHQSGDDYFVGGRNMSSWHVGLSVVATDVGGGFSIGLGGLGFVMGLSGSWMLFTGLIGAWLAAVLLIPKVKRNPYFDKAYTFPELFSHYYSPNVALVAAVISAIGYAGLQALSFWQCKLAAHLP
jgi:Na+/proline symporter